MRNQTETLRHALTRENRFESKVSSTNPESEMNIDTNQRKRRFEMSCREGAPYTSFMLLILADVEFRPYLADQAPLSELISTAGLILTLFIIALLFLAIMLVRSVRRLRSLPRKTRYAQPIQQDPWAEAGRRLKVDDAADD